MWYDHTMFENKQLASSFSSETYQVVTYIFLDVKTAPNI